MSISRKKLVEEIFETFEPDQDGYVHINKINQLFNPDNHPDVLNGKKIQMKYIKNLLIHLMGIMII